MTEARIARLWHFMAQTNFSRAQCVGLADQVAELGRIGGKVIQLVDRPRRGEVGAVQAG